MEETRIAAAGRAFAATTLDEPSGAAHPRVVLTPVPEARTSGEALPRTMRIVVTGAAALVIAAELRHRPDARPAVLCAAAALAAAAAPWRR
ncbi:hypothetical protein HUT06_12130 [Actinomadura sp. NAK00032]|uniref:hypothetical protein n=1 Tax=Actinomadura sp. NAK00032 TaxID=2742128 RepID=UPI001590BFE4|nr:hypothetical protein [Actinomadura sp. NAK00032]QKW34683.1 hypothetical protein HUT06_12130 [Actinomadura sp. NAK00032]